MKGPQASILKQIFGQAMDLDPADLPVFIANSCQGNPELETKVLSLLASHRKPVYFLDPHLQSSSGPATTKLADSMSDRLNWVLLDELPGSIIDRYKLLDVVGQGGHGVVFRAEQNEPIHRVVALKVVRKGSDSAEVKQRFKAERQTLASLDHPNISKLFDAGATSQGRPYFVMELVQGQPLTQYCDEQQLTIRRRVELFITVCRAVQHAHQKGIIHRDLKPSNILIAQVDGLPAPKIIDFGVAKVTTEGPAIADGQIFGTPQYMSPEDTNSQNSSDTRSDVYSLGAILCELLAGTSIIDWDALQVRSVQDLQKAFADSPRIRPSDRFASLVGNRANIADVRQTHWQSLQKALRADLDSIILKATELDRTLRYDSTASLADDLQRYLERRPVSAVQARASYLFVRFCARNKIRVVASVAVVILFFAALVAVSGALIRARRAEAATITHLGESYLQQARSGERSRLPGQRAQSLKAIKLAAQMNPSSQVRLELRNEAIACMSLVDAVPVGKWERSRSQFFVMAAGADRYAVHDVRGDIQVFRRSDRHLICTLPANKAPFDQLLKLSGNGEYVVSKYGETMPIWDVDSQQVVVSSDHERPFDFGNCGDLFAIATSDGNVEIRQLPHGELLKSISAEGSVDEMLLSPEDDRVAVWSEKDGLRVIAIDGTSGVQRLPTNFGRTMAWSPDGCNIAVTGPLSGPHVDFTYSTQIFSTLTGTLQTVLTGRQGPPLGPAYSNDGRIALCGGWDSEVLIYDACNGRELLRLPNYGENLQVDKATNQFSFETGADIQFWQPTMSNECRLFDTVLAGRAILSADMSLDGKLIAGATGVGVRLWDVASGKPCGLLSAPGVRTVLFTPDGKKLIASTADSVMSWNLAEIAGRNDPVVNPVAEGGTCGMAMDQTGHLLVFGDSDRNFRVADPNHLTAGRILDKLTPAPRYAAMSPDGLWAARSSRFDKTFKVWNLKSDTLAAQIDRASTSSEAGQMAFSSDSKTLLIPDSGWYSVGDWKLVKPLPCPNSGVLAFSPDGKMLALSGIGDGIILCDPISGQEFATFKMPANPCGVTSLKFSRDSTKLIVTAGGSALIIWDIPRIRVELASMKLDWNSP